MFSDGCIVGKFLSCRLAVRVKDFAEVKTLRRLSAPKRFARHRIGDARRLRAVAFFNGIVNGQGGDGAVMVVKRVDNAGNRLGIYERAGRVMNENAGRR